jgi:MFS family permease
MAIPVGSALGYVLGGFMVDLTGGWRPAFYVVVLPGILLGAAALLMREPQRGQMEEGPILKQRKARLRDYLTFLQTPSYVLNTLGMTAMTFAVGGIAYWMPYYILNDKYAPGEQTLGGVSFFFGVVVVVSGLAATITGGLAGDWVQRRWTGGYFLVSGLTMLLAFPFVLLVMWAPAPWFWVFIFLSVFCLYFNTGPTNTVLANVTHPAVRASAFAVNIFVIHALGDAISPFLIGLIADYSTLERGFLAVSVTVLLGGLLWLWGSLYLERDSALAPTRLGPASE